MTTQTKATIFAGYATQLGMGTLNGHLANSGMCRGRVKTPRMIPETAITTLGSRSRAEISTKRRTFSIAIEISSPMKNFGDRCPSHHVCNHIPATISDSDKKKRVCRLRVDDRVLSWSVLTVGTLFSIGNVMLQRRALACPLEAIVGVPT